MFSRISGVTEGLVANCDIGSPGANARMAKITRLITSSVGMASKERRKIYWLIGFPRFRVAERLSCECRSVEKPARSYLLHSAMFHSSVSHWLPVGPFSPLIMAECVDR